ncbi:MAG TPA: Zn-ribbon domain-containing OB-fold protein [Rhizomicrobium sp.]|nr:Zn-ribbon domain-containing OB-fold protein [Rhizomicrobium sp.]
MSAAGTAAPKPVVPFLKIEGEHAWLAGSKCGKCGTVFVGERDTCAKCFARGQMKDVKLADTGRLYNFTVVHRNFPGVPVPFVSAIVDLDGGGVLKGNLVGIEPDSEKIKFDMPVKVVYRDAGSKDKEGNSYLAYFFEPAN